MENKWLLLSVISDSDLGRSIDTIRIKSKYIALWYIFDKYLPLIILTKLILTLYVTSWLLLQSNRYLYLSLSLYLYIYLLTLIYSACRAFVNPYITHSHTHKLLYSKYIYCLCIHNVQNWFSHTIKKWRRIAANFICIAIKASQSKFDILRSYSVESVSSVSYIYVRTYILTSTYICLSLSFTFYATKKEKKRKWNAKNHKKKKKTKMHPQLTINILPYIQHHTDLYMQFIMRKSGKLLKLFERNLNSY